MNWRLPLKSANAMVCSSSTRRKPGGPPRCWMYGWPSRLAVARKTLVCSDMNSARSGVIRVFHEPRSSMRAYASREPLRDCTALTVAVKATSLEWPRAWVLDIWNLLSTKAGLYVLPYLLNRLYKRDASFQFLEQWIGS